MSDPRRRAKRSGSGLLPNPSHQPPHATTERIAHMDVKLKLRYRLGDWEAFDAHRCGSVADCRAANRIGSVQHDIKQDVWWVGRTEDFGKVMDRAASKQDALAYFATEQATDDKAV